MKVIPREAKGTSATHLLFISAVRGHKRGTPYIVQVTKSYMQGWESSEFSDPGESLAASQESLAKDMQMDS